MEGRKLPRKEDIQMIACDVDGTLLTDLCVVHPKNKDVIRRIRNDYPQLPIIVITGREFQSANFVREELNITKFPSINSHGAKTYLGDGTLTQSAWLPPDITVEIIERFKNENRFVLGSIGNGKVILHGGKDADFWFKMLDGVKDGVRKDQVVDYTNGDILSEKIKVCKILLPLYDYQSNSTLETLKSIDHGTFLVTRSVSWAFEVVPMNFSKGVALKNLCNILNIDVNKALAFGDAYNDIDMLSTAGYSVAMENAIPQAKSCAKYLTLSNEEGGVGDFLEKIYYQND